MDFPHPSRSSISYRLAVGLLALGCIVTLSSCSKKTHAKSDIDAAARQGDLETVKALLKEKPQLVTGKTYRGRTPLHWAVEDGHADIAEFLLANGADVNARDEMGETPLHLAAIRGQRDLVDLLLFKGANVNERDNHGLTALHWTSQVSVAELLLSDKADINARNNNGISPLHLAISNRHQTMVDFLRQHGAQDLAPTNTPPTGIPGAAQAGKLDQVKALLQAHPEAISDQDEKGRTALHWAAMLGRVEMATFLLANKADVNAKDHHGATPLHLAAKKEMAELLLAQGADVTLRNEDNKTPLHVAAGHNGPHMAGVVEVLLAYHAEVDTRSTKGWTPLLCAALAGNKDTTEALLIGGAGINLPSSDGVTPLHVAAYFAHKEVVELLLIKGADVNAKANDGATPLSNAAGYLGHLDIVELLVAKGADVNAKTNEGITPVHAAVNDKHPDVADFLRQHGGQE